MAYVPLHARVSLNARMHGCARVRMCACAHPYMCVSVCVLCRLGACSWPTLHERVSAQGLELRVLSDLDVWRSKGRLLACLRARPHTRMQRSHKHTSTQAQACMHGDRWTAYYLAACPLRDHESSSFLSADRWAELLDKLQLAAASRA